ncbi:MAG: undecaprenyl/decaprenyl-phosphate alpha-N-acetylglucosaminyl 1-phosphate transferase [Solirubrobacteraceae bacterium]|nr:undecaprenyl/decaprenyl-phosphate alpha-N-acetylglucosaminyl 1-phosphate transferase [Solirubrobacteraceae bacterium]
MLTGIDALAAGGAAAVVTAALTPVSARLARRVGAIDLPRERGLSDRPTPRLGGVAICVGVLVPALIWLPFKEPWKGVLVAALLITLICAVDDVVSLPPLVKLAGQTLCAWIVAHEGARVDNFTLPFIHRVDLSEPVAVIATVLGLVLIMNAVNFSDGVDGLASGVCAIAAASFAVIAFDIPVGRAPSAPIAGVLSAIVAGASLGFLGWNFYPARVLMGDSGSNLLGLMLGCVAVVGTVKTPALIGLIAPLVILAVPFLDTTFVVLKRMKYRRPITGADANHFHHRLSRIGFSPRRTVAYLYAWTSTLAGAALALRFVPYTDRHGHFDTGWTIVMAAILLVALGASVYLVYVLEILKLRRRFRRETEAEVEHRLETGEFQALE